MYHLCNPHPTQVYGIVQKEWSLEACCNVLVRKMKKGAMKRVSSFASMATPGGGWSNLVIGSSGNTGKGPSLATIAASPPEPQMFAKAKAPSSSSQPRPLKPREPPPKKAAPSNPQNNNSGTSLNVLPMVISVAVGAGLTLLLLKVTNRK